MTALLASLLLGAMSLPAQGPETIRVDERIVAVTVPKDNAVISEAEFLGWQGWRYAPAGQREAARVFPKGSQWDSLDSAPNAKSEWRVKFVLRTRADILQKSPNGDLIHVRATLEEPQIEAALQTIGRLRTVLSRATGGQLRLVPEVVIDRNAATFGPNEAPFGVDWLTHQGRLLANRGTYEADDGKYRGPYHAIVFVHPLTGYGSAPMTLDGLPTSSFSFYEGFHPEVEGLSLLSHSFAVWAQRAGYESAGAAAPLPEGAAEIIAARQMVSNPERASRGQAASLVGTPPPMSPFALTDTPVDFVQDGSRGQVLRYSERSPRRVGGFALPKVTERPITIAQTPTFQFWVKTTTPERLGLTFWGEKGVHVTLGPEVHSPVVPAIATRAIVAPTGLTSGEWTQVAIDLRALEGVTGPTIHTIMFGPWAGTLTGERMASGPVEVLLDAFDLVTEPVTNELAPREAIPALTVDALRTASDYGKINLLRDAQALKGPEFAEVLTNLANDLNPRIGELAVRAIAASGTEAALAQLRRLSRIGVSERVRIAATEALGETRNENVVGDLVAVTANPNPAVRRAAALALTKIPGRQAMIVRLSSLSDDDAEVRRAALANADPDEDLHVRKLLWSAVNEAEDELRVIAALRLVQAKAEATRTEGYKVVRDESAGARLWFVQGLADGNPSHRPALLLALTDTDPEVRAAAILALAKQPTKPTDAELSGVANDPYRVVQDALRQVRG